MGERIVSVRGGNAASVARALLIIEGWEEGGHFYVLPMHAETGGRVARVYNPETTSLIDSKGKEYPGNISTRDLPDGSVYIEYRDGKAPRTAVVPDEEIAGVIEKNGVGFRLKTSVCGVIGGIIRWCRSPNQFRI